jgi:predicted ATP-dependent endonuclease of OLD family
MYSIDSQNYWLSLFYNLKKETITVKLLDSENGIGQAKVYFDDKYQQIEINLDSHKTTSRLKIDFFWGDEKPSFSESFINNDGRIEQILTPAKYQKECKFFDSKSRMSQQELVRYHDSNKLELNGDSSFFLEVFKLIDESIEGVETYNIGTANMYLRSKGKPPMPIQLYGDAVYRMASIAAVLTNKVYKVVLIDEIENGIHYSNQKALWNMLYKMAVKLDIQVFATTHSQEMANALTKAANEYEFRDEVAYFELFKHPKTGEIEANQMDMDLLKYKLQHDKEFRG